ncbi:MAG: AmmeMemoRadiSam system radical SAM enzyme [Elusimicrobia bacterium]|nr:AmmeMemoRadiSam system radical SAM enzyme [Elusimicrobiota bacterium]
MFGTGIRRDEMTGFTEVGELFDVLDGRNVRCRACAHECEIRDGGHGVCRVRANIAGRLYVPYGYVAGLQVDPIEKKPFYHVLPGASALSFGMLGCNFSCRFCQNWSSSQALKDPHAGSPVIECSAEGLAEQARGRACPVVVSTYNEPLISSEWAVAVFRKAKERGLRCGFVSNGHATRRALEYLRPWVDFYKVDLKGCDEKRYREVTGGRLGAVLKTIENLMELGFWVEIVTLVVPGFNDSDSELRQIARFIAGLSREIPWHVTAFHKDYRMFEAPNTSAKTLLRAAEIGREEGLCYVYAGNLPGELSELEHTFCPSCGTALVERRCFLILSNRIKGGRCPKCASAIAGVWS